MVVKVAEYTGTLNCKNCVIVPYSSRPSTQTQFKGYDYKKANTSDCGSQTSQQSDNKSEQLWRKQIARWWGSNWRRKRTSLLQKLGKKHLLSELNEKHVSTKNKSVECDITAEDKIETNFTCPQLIPVFKTLSSEIIKKPYTSKRRNKHNERVYEGWMREVGPSDTETDSRTKSLKNRMHYLSIRLRKLNSDSICDNSINKSDNSNNKSDVKVCEYKSPLSGKIYKLDVSKSHVVHVKSDEINHLNAKSCTDKDFLAKPEFVCTTQYYNIRNEHMELLNSICEIVNKKPENKIIETNSDETIVDSNEDVNLSESFYLYSSGYIPYISKSLPIFLERNPQDASTNVLSNNSDLCENDCNYDINYIYNNLDVFKSSITETSFISDYLHNSLQLNQ